ncbi:MAG: hypothetical protein FWD74_05010 [Actinomycetia bacterium]|nr:hypothetical protein [Actinomycetes bacterium]
MHFVLSFLAGLVIAGGFFVGSVVLVRRAGKVSPALGFVVAALTYTVLIVGFAVVLAVASAAVLSKWGFAGGLCIAAVMWIIMQIYAARPGAKQ